MDIQKKLTNGPSEMKVKVVDPIIDPESAYDALITGDPSLVKPYEGSKLRTSLADQFPGEKLESALIDIEDLMARIQVQFFVLGETAKQMYNKEKLLTDGIDIGIRRNELTPDRISTLNTLEPSLHLTGAEDGFTYLWQDVPIRIKYLDSEDELYKRADHVWYNAWEYNIPNPFKEYLSTL